VRLSKGGCPCESELFATEYPESLRVVCVTVTLDGIMPNCLQYCYVPAGAIRNPCSV
jgi:hypothetical protein